MLQLHPISPINPTLPNFAFIPTSEGRRIKLGENEQGRPIISFAETREQNQQLINKYRENTRINLYIPSDDNISMVKWGYSATHSPRKRAELLYDAIFVKGIENIYITGGRGADDAIIELEKIIQEKQPVLTKKVNVFGMSDATHILNYLGQKGYATPFISRGDFRQAEPLNQSVVYDGERIEGIMLPEYLMRSWGTMQQTRLITGQVSFLATEIRFDGELELMKQLYKDIDRNSVVFCLSAVGDISIGQQNQNKLIEQAKFKKWCKEQGFRVIEGLKFGHNNKDDQYAPIPTYCKCVLDRGSLIVDSEGCIPTTPPTDMFVDIPLTLSTEQKYIPNGSADIAMFGSNGYNLKPNERGVLQIEFKDYDEKTEMPYSVYVQNLERCLKDIAKLNIGGVREIEIKNFTLNFTFIKPRQINQMVQYILESRDYFKGKKVSLGLLNYTRRDIAKIGMPT